MRPPAVLLLADNDALLRAAHWGLLDCVPSLADVDWEHTAVLPQFPPRAARADPKLFGSADVAAALLPYLARCCSLPEPDVSVLVALQGVQRIDAGELVLVGALLATPGSCLLTGDKHAVRALAPWLSHPALSGAAGRVYGVEHLLWHALQMLGPDELVHRIRRWPDLDKMTLAIVGRTGAKTLEQLQEGLMSYRRALEAEAPGLLVPTLGR